MKHSKTLAQLYIAELEPFVQGELNGLAEAARCRAGQKAVKAKHEAKAAELAAERKRQGLPPPRRFPNPQIGGMMAAFGSTPGAADASGSVLLEALRKFDAEESPRELDAAQYTALVAAAETATRNAAELRANLPERNGQLARPSEEIALVRADVAAELAHEEVRRASGETDSGAKQRLLLLRMKEKEALADCEREVLAKLRLEAEAAEFKVRKGSIDQQDYELLQEDSRVAKAAVSASKGRLAALTVGSSHRAPSDVR